MTNLLSIIRVLPEVKENADIRNFGFLSVHAEDPHVKTLLTALTRHIEAIVDRDIDRMDMHRRASRGLGRFTKSSRREEVFPAMVETAVEECLTDLLTKIIQELESCQYEISSELRTTLKQKQNERMNSAPF